MSHVKTLRMSSRWLAREVKTLKDGEEDGIPPEVSEGIPKGGKDDRHLEQEGPGEED